MAVWGSGLLLNLWRLVMWQYGITVWLSTNIKQAIKRSFPLRKDNFLSVRKGHSYTVIETFIRSLVHSHSENIFTSMTLYFFFCRKAMASLSKPDQTGPYLTPIFCVRRVTRTEMKSYYSNEPCNTHKEHEIRFYIYIYTLRNGVFWISNACFYTGLAFPLPLQALLTDCHVAVLSDQQQEGDPLLCSSISAIWGYGMPRMTMNLPLERHDALWVRYLLTAEKRLTPNFLNGNGNSVYSIYVHVVLSFPHTSSHSASHLSPLYSHWWCSPPAHAMDIHPYWPFLNFSSSLSVFFLPKSQSHVLFPMSCPCPLFPS